MSEQWYVGRDSRQSGPFALDEVRQMRADGRLAARDLVWREGMPDWTAAASVAELAESAVGGILPPIDSGTIVRSAPAIGDRPGGSGGEWNPYAAPADVGGDVGATTPDGPIVYADYLPRVGAAILDQIFLLLLTLPAGFLIGLVAAVLGAGSEGTLGLLGNAIGFGVSLAYYVGLESSAKQATWGKQICGIKVTDLRGGRITAGRATGRYFAKIVSALSFGIGYLMPLVTARRQTLHDMLVGCLAVTSRPR